LITDFVSEYQSQLQTLALYSLEAMASSSDPNCPNIIDANTLINLEYEAYSAVNGCGRDISCAQNGKQQYTDLRNYLLALNNYMDAWITALHEAYMPALWTSWVFKVMLTTYSILAAIRAFVNVTLRLRMGTQEEADLSFNEDDQSIPRLGCLYWGYLYSTVTFGSTLMGSFVFGFIVFMHGSVSIHYPEKFPLAMSTYSLPELTESLENGPPMLDWILRKVLVLVMFVIIHIAVGEVMSRRWCEGPINYAGSQRTKRILYPFWFILLYVPYAALTYTVAYELFFSRWIMICVFAALSCFQMEYTIMPESIALFDSAWASQIQVVCMTNRIQNPILVGFFQQWLYDARERRKRCTDEQVDRDLGKLRLANRLWLCILLRKHPTLRGYRRYQREDDAPLLVETRGSDNCNEEPAAVVVV